MKITAVIPAHNEELSLPGTIESIKNQTIPPDRILVVSDNSSDSTVKVARSYGVDVIETVNNTHRKAGALNQGLMQVESELVLLVDADTKLSERFIEVALDKMRDETVGGVGAVFHGENPDTPLKFLQSMEWERYAEQIERTGKVFVLSGTASLVRMTALRDVEKIFGRVYDPHSITEDMRLTLDLKNSGWRLVSPGECSTTTELMPSLRLLFYQRRRWSLGAIQNICSYGLTRVSAPYWGQQTMLLLSIFLMGLYIFITSFSIAAGTFAFQPLWVAVGSIFLLERVVTVWHCGWRAKLTAALVVPELMYALVLQIAHLSAIYQFLRRSSGTWNHVGGK